MGEGMIQIRAASDGDRPQVLMRIREVFGERAALEAEQLWHWQWHQDPRLAEPGYRAMVADWDGSIVGNLALIPAGLYVEGRLVPANWCVSALVHWGLARRALRAARRAGQATGLAAGQGIAEAMYDAAAVNEAQIGKHISRTMRTVLIRMGYMNLPNSGSLHRRISLRQRLRRGVGSVPAALIAPIADLMLPRLPRAGLAVEVMDGPFDERFDALWTRLYQRCPAVTLRDRATLQWRYRQHPALDYVVLTLAETRALRGYLIYCTFERDGRLRGKIVDLFTDPADDEAMRSLVAVALRAMKQGQIERVEAFAATDYLTDVLTSAGFTPRLTKADEVQPLLMRGISLESLHIGQGDGDGG
jgi:hypothetical protein